MEDVKAPLLDSTEEEESSNYTHDSRPADKVHLDVDGVFNNIGSWGNFNIFLLIALTFCHTTIIFQFTFSYFIGNQPPWKCSAHTNNTNTHINSTNTTDFCTLYPTKEIHVDDPGYYKRCEMTRSNWTYTTTDNYSYTTEFGLQCHRRLLGAMLSAIYFLGFVMNIIVAPGLDAWGRKRVVWVTLLLGVVSSLMASAVTEVWQLMVLRFIEGGAFTMTSSIIFLWLIEFSTPSSRSSTAVVYFVVSSSLSNFGVSLLAFNVREWRLLNLYASLPAILGLLVIPLIPRSPRWLVEKGKMDEAENILKRASRINGKTFTFKLRQPPTAAVNRIYTYVDLVRYWKPFRMTFCMAFIYMAIGLISYQVSLEADKLGADIYISFVLSTLSDIPGSLASCYLCNKLGRKKSVLGSVFVSGVIMASISFVPWNASNRHTIRLILAMLSKITVGVANFGFFIWAFESFPTVIRGQGCTVSVVFHQLGVIAVPLANSLLQRDNPLLVYIFVGLCAILASILGCVLEETNNKPTKEKYEDILED